MPDDLERLRGLRKLGEPPITASIPIKEFVDVGYLQEVNRRFLHPLGLALEASVADEPTVLLHLRADDADRLRVLTERLAASSPELAKDMAALQKRIDESPRLEAGDGYISSIWDARDDPEGVVFGDGVADAGKAARIAADWEIRGLAREAALGFVVQPVEP